MKKIWAEQIYCGVAYQEYQLFHQNQLLTSNCFFNQELLIGVIQF